MNPPLNMKEKMYKGPSIGNVFLIPATHLHCTTDSVEHN